MIQTSSFTFSEKISSDSATTREDVENLTPKEYFDSLKEAVKLTNKKELINAIEVSKKQLEKAIKLKMDNVANKLKFIINTNLNIIKLIDKGCDRYVSSDVVKDLSAKVSDKSVYICELSQFHRVIPDDVADIIADVMEYFTHIYIVYTDYSKEAKDRVDEVKIEKDPIIFGAFKDTENKILDNRLFYIADYVDEYCDLTLQSIIDTLGKDYVQTIKEEDVLDINNINHQLVESK